MQRLLFLLSLHAVIGSLSVFPLLQRSAFSLEFDSDSDVEIIGLSPPNPPSKRRRVLEPSAITSGPIYSNKVTRSLRMKPSVFRKTNCTEVNGEAFSINLSDSEEELGPDKPREHNQKLDALSSLLCLTSKTPEDILDVSDINCYDRNNDIIIVSSEDKPKRRTAKPKRRKRAQEISLKFRCQLDVHKIPVLSTDPLSKAVAQLSVKLNVPPSKILLMRNDAELPVRSTITQLDLGIADIIDCLVITDDKEDESSCDVITVRLQGKEKGSAKEYSVQKNAPLGSVLSQYTSGLSAAAKRKVRFLFDGLKVTRNQTPLQLDMEDGDVIDVWA
ncbi:NFATC2-interacting protein isoform X1 [Hemibagrus wyckioides]|uniref:NFATC2-interacting protein isoform X1 n=1 Tax=Hemibagrus wyckioides TaxID=337641 RepID=UPI00266C46A8|nr:NFATC2-interacting protein isoform X1 [Hemibagrus wyckioides]